MEGEQRFLVRRRAWLAAAAAGVGAAVGGAARAEPAHDLHYPEHAVRLIVPFPPGGATDVLARLIAETAAARWQHGVIVENRPGANSALGTDLVARSAPDGHVLGIVTGSHVTNPLLGARLPYDTLHDLTGVMALARFHMGLFAHPSLPAATAAELLTLARAQGPPLSYACGTTHSYLAMELLAMRAGIKLQYVPFNGSAPALHAVIGGHTPLMIDPVLAPTLEHVKAGRLKLLATMAAEPSPLAPQAGLLAAAVPSYEYSAVIGLVARGGTPMPLLRRIRDDIAAVLAQPQVAERVRALGQEVLATTPEAYNSYLMAELKKWEPVVKATGARLQ